MNSFAPFPSLDSTSIYLKTEAGFLFDLSALHEGAKPVIVLKAMIVFISSAKPHEYNAHRRLSTDLIFECPPVTAFASLIFVSVSLNLLTCLKLSAPLPLLWQRAPRVRSHGDLQLAGSPAVP